MTDDEARALGVRAIKAGCGWRPGMLPMDAETGATWVRVREDEPDGWFGPEPYDWSKGLERAVPDLRDPATRGAALEVVRERWRGTVWMAPRLLPAGRIAWAANGMCVDDDRRVNGANGFDSEAEALVAALESAP